ncbi:MAG: hypothetical protein MPW15_13100 [Candidatus Manganitrophus sp.]|nr:hypothetical protein [Candidatus Manganitrophus sp.]
MRGKRTKSGTRALVGIILLGLVACAEAPIEKRPTIFWPEPPDPPKVSFVQNLTQPKDVGVKPSWFKKVINFIFGEKEPPYLIRPSGVTVDEEGGSISATPDCRWSTTSTRRITNTGSTSGSRSRTDD